MAHFNKRHYEAIAQLMQDTRPGPGYGREIVHWLNIRAKLADTFAADNGLFDRGRFEHACLPGSNVKAKTAHLKVAS